ncbi:MAG: RHS repeat-associated core domain-containing protein, partial [Phycisphaeraceae bacterium]|nr:RHS repeat-associated core domain-containing protein [Phycisphaeraceae bacterium]
DDAGRLQADRVANLGGDTDGHIQRIEWTFDDRGRVTFVTSYDAPTAGSEVNQVAYTYNDDPGQWGALTTIWQDHGGEVEKQGGSPSPSVGYTMQVVKTDSEVQAMRLASVTYPSPPETTETRREVHFRYPGSGDGHVLSRVHEIASAASGGDVYAAYGYLGAGSIVRMERPAVKDGLKLTYDNPNDPGSFPGLDRFGRVTTQKWTDTDTTPATLLDGYAYAHDASGNRTRRENLVSKALTPPTHLDEVYVHDQLNRLIQAERGELDQFGDEYFILGATMRHEPTLDALGNWTWVATRHGGGGDQEYTRLHDEANQITSITPEHQEPVWVNPSHDSAGNMTQAPDGLDPTEKRHLVYDAWNRLVAVTDGGDPATTIVTYRYNGLGHRVAKLLGSDPENPDKRIDYYHNAGWQVVEERVDGDVHAQYLWCLSYIDTPVLRWRDTTGNEELDETLYYTVDANKNVTALINAATGNVVERYLYDPYGRVMVLDDGWDSIAWSASRKNEILFAGYRYNPETGYYHVRHRELHPMLGRFMQRDPLGYVDGGNLYEVTRSNPSRYSDPYGLFTLKEVRLNRPAGTIMPNLSPSGNIGHWGRRLGRFNTIGRHVDIDLRCRQFCSRYGLQPRTSRFTGRVEMDSVLIEQPDSKDKEKWILESHWHARRSIDPVGVSRHVGIGTRVTVLRYARVRPYTNYLVRWRQYTCSCGNWYECMLYGYTGWQQDDVNRVGTVWVEQEAWQGETPGHLEIDKDEWLKLAVGILTKKPKQGGGAN